MNNGLEVFKNAEFGEMRGMVIDGKPWFVGKDVATILGYKDTSDALKRHVDDEDKLTRCFTDSGQGRQMYVVNESGVYSLIFSSKLPKAKEFKRWVTNEVLPAIRKTGGYIAGEENMNEDELILRAMQVLQNKVNTLKLENAKKEQIISELQPKADYTDTILQSKGSVPITMIAKDYGISAQALNKILADLKVQYKLRNQWLLYSNYQGLGYTHSRTVNIVRYNGTPDSVMQTEWTQKGRLFLYELLKKQGILPMIEMD